VTPLGGRRGAVWSMTLYAPSRRRLLGLLALASCMPWSAVARGPVRPGLIAAEVCHLTPELTEGPFYFDPRLDRADVAEGRPGLAVDLALQVVDPSCAPIRGARVDIWQCDALGVYSGTTASPGETFMRGSRPTDAEGVARFRTLYPGWYRGRAPHIHFKARLDDGRTLTSQLFFPDELSRPVYALPPYAGRKGRQDTFYANDRIAATAGPAALAKIEARPDLLVASLTVGVDSGLHAG
jgi:protocatechuate 3,4-dioxygenase beta subunit